MAQPQQQNHQPGNLGAAQAPPPVGAPPPPAAPALGPPQPNPQRLQQLFPNNCGAARVVPFHLPAGLPHAARRLGRRVHRRAADADLDTAIEVNGDTDRLRESLADELGNYFGRLIPHQKKRARRNIEPLPLNIPSLSDERERSERELLERVEATLGKPVDEDICDDSDADEEELELIQQLKAWKERCVAESQEVSSLQSSLSTRRTALSAAVVQLEMAIDAVKAAENVVQGSVFGSAPSNTGNYDNSSSFNRTSRHRG